MKREVLITKASGERETFSESKLRASLGRSKADKQVIDEVVGEVRKMLYEGMSTGEIYKKAFSLLRNRSHPSAARYKLKRAIFELGPSGFPFEQFVAKILQREGYLTKTNVVLKGKCVKHEVDLLAEKDDKHFMVECKFHSEQGRICDVKIPLYIDSRFRDLIDSLPAQKGHRVKLRQGWIYTNTRFSKDAIQYGSCAGLALIGWNYPKNNSLKDRIDRAGLHPVTCMSSLTREEKQQLLNRGKVLCMDICENPGLLAEIGVKEGRMRKVKAEAHALCGMPGNEAG